MSATLRRRMVRVPAVLALLAVLVAALWSAPVVQAKERSSKGRNTVLEAKAMVGVPDAYTGTQAPIRGLNGGGAPWVVDKADVRLRSDGRLQLRVQGLIIPDRPDLNPAVRGRNPAAAFRAVVSCQAVVDGVATVRNVATDPFPATPTGDARIDVELQLPDPCIAPIVLVTNVNLAWFAATGIGD